MGDRWEERWVWMREKGVDGCSKMGDKFAEIADDRKEFRTVGCKIHDADARWGR
jgi:hypothetical protein